MIGSERQPRAAHGSLLAVLASLASLLVAAAFAAPALASEGIETFYHHHLDYPGRRPPRPRHLLRTRKPRRT